MVVPESYQCKHVDCTRGRYSIINLIVSALIFSRMPSWLLCWDPRTPLNSTTWRSSTVKFKLSTTLAGHSWADLFRLAVNNDWKLEEAWGLYLVSLPYMNLNHVICISDSLQARISFWTMWGRRPWQRTAMSWDISACSMGCARNRVSHYSCCHVWSRVWWP